MAWTTTKTSQFNAGNQVVQLWNITTDSSGATLDLDTGLDVVNHAELSPASMDTANSRCAINVLADGTATNGTVTITGCTDGDHMFLTVYGR